MLAEQLALDDQYGKGVALGDKRPHVILHLAGIHADMRQLIVLMQADLGKGERQVEIAQAQLSGAADGRAAEQGIPPDAVSGQLVALGGLEAQGRLIGQGGQQVADQLQFSRWLHFQGGIGQLQGGQSGAGQTLFDAQAMFDSQLREQLKAGDAALEWAAGRTG